MVVLLNDIRWSMVVVVGGSGGADLVVETVRFDVNVDEGDNDRHGTSLGIKGSRMRKESTSLRSQLTHYHRCPLDPPWSPIPTDGS